VEHHAERTPSDLHFCMKKTAICNSFLILWKETAFI